MKLFKLFSRKKVERVQWTVVFRTRRNEIKSLMLMARDEKEILEVLPRMLPSGIEYFGATKN